MTAFRDHVDREESAAAIAPCGPECRFAHLVGGGGRDYVWCELKGAPRSTGSAAVDCGWFRPRPNVAPGATGKQQ